MGRFLLSKSQKDGSFILRDPQNLRKHCRMCGEVVKELSASKTLLFKYYMKRNYSSKGLGS